MYPKNFGGLTTSYTLALPFIVQGRQIEALFLIGNQIEGEVHTLFDTRHALVAGLIEGRTAVASNGPYLAECGITGLDGVRSGFTGEAELREMCSTAGAGTAPG